MRMSPLKVLIIILDNPSSTFLAYAFALGDRGMCLWGYFRKVQLLRLYYNCIGGNQPVKDYEIQGTVTDPVINGQQQQGEFVKIILPTTDINFDFGIQLWLIPIYIRH